MKTNRVDPRTKFLVVLFITGIGVASSNISLLFVNLLLGLIYAKAFDVKILHLIHRLKRVLYLLLFIIIIQSIFISEGSPIITIFGIDIITDVGLKRGIGYLFRVITIFLSGAIISTSSTSDILKGFAKLGLPYEIAFTSSLGVRFLPILVDEIKSTYTAIQLRGIDIKKLKLNKRVQIISYLFMPVICSTIVRSKNIAESVETRGFKVGGKRSNYRDIFFSKQDYIIFVVTFIVFASMIYFFKTKGDLYESFISSRL